MILLRERFGVAAPRSRSIDPAEERLLWQEARLVLPLAALESIRRIERFTREGQALETAGDTGPSRRGEALTMNELLAAGSGVALFAWEHANAGADDRHPALQPA